MTAAGTSVGREALLELLRSRLGEDAVLTDASDREPYEHGWRYGHGVALAVVRPSTPEDVSWVVREAARHDVPVHPIGANTGLVGASNPDASGRQLVLAFERLDRVVEIDPIDRTVVCDAGVTLSALNEALEPHGLFFPIDLGADPQIGGMVATNTGGSRLCRYGDVRQNLLGVQVVLPDGTVVDRLRALRKDNTGLDFKQLFVGTSGTWGFVTRAVLRVEPLPVQTVAAFAGLRDGESVLRLLQHLERTTGGFLSAFEVVSRNALEATLRHGANVQDPFRDSGLPGFAALVELSTTLDEERLPLAGLLESALESWMETPDLDEDAVVDVLVDGRDRGRAFWALRHQVSESLREEGEVLAFDVSVPRSRMAAFTAAAGRLLEERWPFARMCDFGHWADGGTHLNVVWRPEDAPAPRDELVPAIQEAVYDLCVRGFGGSHSAEHGVGPHNRAFQERYADPAVQGVERALDRYFRP